MCYTIICNLYSLCYYLSAAASKYAVAVQDAIRGYHSVSFFSCCYTVLRFMDEVGRFYADTCHELNQEINMLLLLLYI